MKKILVIIFLLSYSIVDAQKTNRDRIYWTALDRYTLNLDKTGHNTQAGDKAKTIYIEKPFFIDSIPPMINGYLLTLITNNNQRELYKLHHNKLIHTKIFPIVVEDSLLKISIIPFRGELKKSNHYNLGVSDGCSIYFRFDTSKKQFIFDKISSWGI